MELIGSLSRDIRSLCVVIHWLSQEKLKNPKKTIQNVISFEYW
ncbi:hypothetical protein ICW_02982 [Bacillus wiedmannii]|nr:hypothetical protein ICW_02982 [Bacillus wiedmannii]EJV65082.1 hypothetical protein IEO_02178 [Bacillus wiedmannii]OFD11698.1 hypothetical protein BTGOE6_08710 [Bacillus wiedmannii]